MKRKIKEGLYEEPHHGDLWVLKEEGGHALHNSNGQVGEFGDGWEEEDYQCMGHFLVPLEYMT